MPKFSLGSDINSEPTANAIAVEELNAQAANSASVYADTEEALATALSGNTSNTPNPPDTPVGPPASSIPSINESTEDQVSEATPVVGSTSTTPNTPGTPTPPGTPTTIYTAPDGTQFTDQQAYATYMASYNAIQAQKAAAAAASANAIQLLSAQLQAVGLPASIAPLIQTIYANGYTDMTTIAQLASSNVPFNTGNAALDSAMQALQAQFATRFSGNVLRENEGLQPLSISDYVAAEQSYKGVLAQAGIASNSPLMDQNYIGKLIGADVSPLEAQMRVQTAQNVIQNEDPAVLAQLQSQFGLTTSTILSHVLDPAVTAPIVQQEYNAATIAAEAARAGVAITVGNTGGNTMSNGLTNQNALQMQLAAQGVTQAQAAQSFQTIAQQQPNLQSIANRYGAGITGAANIGSALQATQFGLTGAAQAQAELNRLTTAEISAFSGSAGAVTGSLGPRDTSGQI